ncbi:MAG: outer membrane beta-barrel protein [Crocinitomicaceae bacterium]
MKKITILLFGLFILSTSFGQEEEKKKEEDKKEEKQKKNKEIVAENGQDLPQDKKFQAGLSVASALSWYRPQSTVLGTKGQDATFSFGVNMNYMFVKNVGISVGLEFDWDWYHADFEATDSIYYRHTTSEILRKKDNNSTAPGFRVTDRTYKPLSISIPTMLIFKTNLIGYFKYYGKFGLRTSFVVNQTVKDKGFEYDNLLTTQTNPDEVTYDKLKVKNDLLWIKSAVGVAGGFEYFFTSSNAFYAEISFFYGFSNLHNGNAWTGDEQKNMSLMNSNFEYFALKSNLNQLFLKVGIMF